MPKDRRVQSLSFDLSRASPYPCGSSSRDANQYKNELPSGSLEDTKEATARPYICDTSYRHPNCLDQFKTLASTPSNETVQENPPTSINPSITKEEASLPGQSKHGMILLPPNLSCPLYDPSNIFIILLGTYLIYEVEEYLYRDIHIEQLNSNLRSLRFGHNMYINHDPRHRWINNRLSLTYGGRCNMDTNLDSTHDPRWNYNLQEESTNHGRYNVETNHNPRSNDSLPLQRTNNSQVLLWRDQQMHTFDTSDSHQH
ncbi:hypothetical protein QYF36_011745 [Acer negundo]|nr:hypothetical protein QYF36_011745 [Acer negundo]